MEREPGLTRHRTRRRFPRKVFTEFFLPAQGRRSQKINAKVNKGTLRTLTRRDVVVKTFRGTESTAKDDRSYY